MAQISAQEGALRAGYQAVEEAHNNISQQVTNLGRTLDSIRGVWSGDAHVAYDQLTNAWNEQCSKMLQALDRLKDNLQSTERDQIRTENAHEDSIRNIQGSIQSLLG